MGGARGPLNMDVNWPDTPFVVNSRWCGHAKSGDNIYASKPAKYNFLQGNLNLIKSSGAGQNNSWTINLATNY